jgi:predicted Mrr-cat superfamily restriction endonuclease
MIAALDPREVEHLVAGILRAMGFKTRVSPVGPDRGKDIVASPDGFGFKDPRIVVEVKQAHLLACLNSESRVHGCPHMCTECRPVNHRPVSLLCR